MKIYASSDDFFIRIVDNVDDEFIRDYLRSMRMNSYIAAFSPFIDIRGPEDEYYDIVDFLSSNNIFFRSF